MTVCEKVCRVGISDSEIRTFHGCTTPKGTTYNSYLVTDEKTTLIGLVGEPFADEFLENLEQALGGKTVDVIILNQSQPCNAGALPKVLERYPDARIYGTAQCKTILQAYYPQTPLKFTAVRSGHTLCTGELTFDFLPVSMLHWPDSMVTYLRGEGLLFSGDAFSQHNSSPDDTTHDAFIDDLGYFYANELMPFSTPVRSLMNILSELEIRCICPSHGSVITDNLSDAMAKYRSWSASEADDNRAVIIYDTMCGTTKRLAHKLKADYAERGIEAEIINMGEATYSYAAWRILEARHIAIGSPTLNNNTMPTIYAFLTYMRGLKPKKKIGKAFGSYGWSGEAVNQIGYTMETFGFKIERNEGVMWNFE